MKHDSLIAEAIVLAVDMATFFILWLVVDMEWYWAAIISTVVVYGSWSLTKYDIQKKK